MCINRMDWTRLDRLVSGSDARTVDPNMHVRPHHSAPFQRQPQQQRLQRQRGAVRAAAGDGETQWKRVSVLVRFFYMYIYIYVCVDLGGFFLDRIDQFCHHGRRLSHRAVTTHYAPPPNNN